MTQRQIFILAFFLLLSLVFLQLVFVFRLFLMPLLWAVVLALVFFPLHEKILAMLKGRANFAALLMCALVFLVTAGPMTFFSGTLVKEAVDFYHKAGLWLSSGKWEEFFHSFRESPLHSFVNQLLEKTEALDIEMIPLIKKAVATLSEGIVNQIQSGAKNFLVFVVSYLVTLFVLFFFFRDGAFLVKALKDLFPMTEENKGAFFGRLTTTVSAVVRGLVVTGVVQGSLAGVAFWVLGVPFPVFQSCLIAFLAVIPIGGAVFVWFPSVVYLALSGMWVKAVILFLWGALVVSTVDNFLKPWLIGGQTRMPTLFLFLAILGGLVYYGLIGVFLGPVMLALFLTLIGIYRREYLNPDS